MKKFLSVLLAVLLFLSPVGSFSSFAESVSYRVNVKTAYVLPEPSLDATPVAEVFMGDLVTVDKLSENGRFAHIFINSAGIEGWLYAPQLTAELALTQGEDSIAVFTYPAKTVYIDGEDEFDATGLFICRRFANGSPQEIVSGYQLYVPSLKTPGQKTVYVTWRPDNSLLYYTTSFHITVQAVPALSLTVETQPDKPLNSYIEGEALDLTGLTLRLKYTEESGREDSIFTLEDILNNPDFTITGCHNETQGTALTNRIHTVTVSYKYPEITCTLKPQARQKTLTALTVIRYPDNTTMYTGQTKPDVTGLILRADYDNGLSKELTPENVSVLFDPATLKYGEGNMVEIKYTSAYGTMSVYLNYTYAVYEAVGIKVKTPEVLTYILGEPIDLSEYSVYTEYSDGSLKPAADAVFGSVNPLQTGAQTVTVTSGIYSAAFTIYITPYYQKGDINNDAKVTAADARLALRHAVGIITLNNKPLSAGDVDNDGKVTASDARLILRAAVGLEDFLKHLK